MTSLWETGGRLSAEFSKWIWHATRPEQYRQLPQFCSDMQLIRELLSELAGFVAAVGDGG